MPLQQGSSREVIEANIRELIAANHSPEQAAAIAYKEAGQARDDGIRAAGILYRVGNKVLLLKRSAESRDYPGHWGLPGGHIEQGEVPEQAARRESLEEIGYTAQGDIKPVGVHDGFLTFSHQCDHFAPVLDGEHTGYAWAGVDDLPTPTHPGVLALLADSSAMDESARRFNEYGWMTVEGNPISKVGVFPYLGKQIGAPEPDRIYMVYRPAEELNNPETIESFKLTPFINEHPEKLLGNVGNLVATDSKRVEGVIGEKVYFEYPYLKANLRVYSAQTLGSIDAGKEEVSAGYRCIWSREDGVFEGQPYQYVQRNIRGNHSALVVDGRSGPDVSVMDSMTFNKEFQTMDAKQGAAGEVTLVTIAASLEALATTVGTLQGAMDSVTEKVDELEKKGEGMDNDDEDEAKKKAEEESKSKGESMDAATFNKAVAAEVARQLAARPAAMDAADFAANMAKKNDLANRLSNHIGVFDHAAMDHAAVAVYGAEKLGLDKEHAVIAVESYLKARPQAGAYSMDTGAGAKSTGAAFLAEQLK